MKRLNCRDAGMDCDWFTQADDEEVILDRATEHLKTYHNYDTVSDDLLLQIRSLIKDVKAA